MGSEATQPDTTFETLKIERHGRVARLSFNRPDRLNSFNTALRNEFVAAARALNADPEVWVVLLAAEGRAFSAGADLAEPGNDLNDGRAVEDQLNYEYKPGILAIVQAPKPWLAAINGPCAGIGYSYAMACDLAVMADDAFLYQPFAAIGLIPDGGATWLLPQLVGRKRAYELMVMGEKLPAEKALAWGLVNRVVPAPELQAEALLWAQDLAGRSPLSLRYTKEAVNFALDHSLSDSIGREAAYQRHCIDSDDAKAAVQAFFEKRAPEWSGA